VIPLSASEAKPLFPRGGGLTLRFLLLAIASLVLITVDHRTDYLDIYRAKLSLIVYPLQVAADLPFSTTGWLSNQMQDRHALIEENSTLKRQALMYSAKLQKMAALSSENKRLRELLQAAEQLEEQVLVAEILNTDLDPYRQIVLLNKGEQHGVYPGQALIDAHGVVGQVISVGTISATALLIADANHGIPVEVNRSGLRTVAYGTGKIDSLDVPLVPNGNDIKVGDLLITSGLGQRFPAGYPVAEIIEVHDNNGLGFAKIVARPTAKLNKTRQVLLVWQKSLMQKTTLANEAINAN